MVLELGISGAEKSGIPRIYIPLHRGAEYTRKLIDIVGKGGGFIMSSRTALDDANPVLVKLWADITREYGIYR
jgi:hypothetical protein